MVAIRYDASKKLRRNGEDWQGWGNPVEYRPDASAQVLERVAVEGSMFHWAINPYVGCEFGCLYDVAQPTLADPNAWGEFEHHIGVKVKGVMALCEHLRGMAERGDRSLQGYPIIFGTHTDPWQPAEREQHVTQALLEKLALLPGLDLRATTRSSLVGRDVELFKAIARTGKVRIRIAFSSLDRRQAALLEPKAPSPDRRLVALELLAKAGLEVGVALAPVIKGVNDAPDAVEQLLERASDVGARFVTAEPWTAPDLNREALVGYVTTLYPDKSHAYRRLYAKSHVYEGRPWAAFLERLHALRTKHGLGFADAHGTILGVAPREAAEEKVPPEQLKLF